MGRVSIADVAEAVAEVFEVSVAQMQGPARQQEICVPRHVAMALARDMTGASFPALGRFFHRDHTSVLNAQRRFEAVHAAHHGDQVKAARKLARARAGAVFLRQPRAVFRSVRGAV